MSKIGKQPITLPSGVTATIGDGRVTVNGSRGTTTVSIPAVLRAAQEGGALSVEVRQQTKASPALWGLTRALLANAVEGVSSGFTRRLVLEGIGYRANLEGKDLVLSLGFSHPIRVAPPEGIDFSVEKNVITISGFNKQHVGNVAASIRRFRKPEPYKGKGIRYENEVIRRKAGKKAATVK